MGTLLGVPKDYHIFGGCFRGSRILEATITVNNTTLGVVLRQTDI